MAAVAARGRWSPASPSLDRGFTTIALRAPEPAAPGRGPEWGGYLSPEGDGNKAPVEAWRGRGMGATRRGRNARPCPRHSSFRRRPLLPNELDPLLPRLVR